MYRTDNPNGLSGLGQTNPDCPCTCVEKTVKETLYINPIRLSGDDVPVTVAKSGRRCDPIQQTSEYAWDCETLLPNIKRSIENNRYRARGA